MREEVARAIKERRIIELNYTVGRRRVEPHAIGYGSSGAILVRAFQIEGASASGEHEWWKLFRLEKCQSLSLSEERFEGPRPEYRRGDKHMPLGIIAEL